MNDGLDLRFDDAATGELDGDGLADFVFHGKPNSMSELYSRMDHELDLRLQEAKTVGVGFTVQAYVAPKCSKILGNQEVAIAA